MTYVLPFDFRLACFKPDDKLFTGSGPAAEYPVNPQYSLLIAHIYAALYSGQKSLVIVSDPSLLAVCQQLLPNYRFATAAPKQLVGNTVEVRSIDVADTDKIEFRGTLLKPVYIEADSTIVYMIASLEDVVEHCPGAFLRDSLRYFNQVIRNAESGVGRVIWKDPVAQLSKLRDGYDVMFCLYILDKCMQAIDPAYPAEDVESNLAKVLALHKYLLGAVTKKSKTAAAAPTEITVVHKELSSIPISLNPKERYTATMNVPLGLRESPTKRAFSDVLYFAITSDIKPTTTATFLYGKGYNNVQVISALAKIFPKATHIAFGVSKGRPGITCIPGEFTKEDAREYSNTGTYFFYGDKKYDAFVTGLKPIQALVPYDMTSTIYHRIIFGSIFTSTKMKDFPVLTIVDATLKKSKTRHSTVEFSRSLNYNWRNIKAWSYTNPITGNEDIYDEATLAAYIKYFHDTYNLTGSLEDFYRLLLSQLKG